MTLFPEPDSYSSEEQPNHESNFDFFTRVSGWPDMEEARARLEVWFSHLPDKEKARTRQAMSQGGDDLFDACFFELFLHEFLLASGCDPEIHPSLVDRKRAPDFAARSGAGVKFLMEAAVVTDKTDRERSVENLQGQILDILNSLPSPRMSFAIRELMLKSHELPSLGEIRKFVLRQIAAAPEDRVSLRDAVWEYEDARVKLGIRPIPLTKKTWSSNVGIGQAEFRFGGPEAAIAAKLHKKATRYGKLEEPFVIAVNVVSRWTNELACVTRTLLGVPKETLLQEDGASALQKHLGSDSFWHKNGSPRHTTVSAVLATRMFPQSVLRAPLCLYHNPHARYPLPGDALPVEQITPELVIAAGKSLRETLD